MKKYQKQFINLLILFVVAATLLVANYAMAQDTANPGEGIANKMISGIKDFKLPSGGGQEGKIETVIGKIIQTFLSIFGILFLGLMVYGGFKWMIAQGREEEVKKAKDIIRSSIIGLGIVLIAYAITYFVVYMFFLAGEG